MNYKTKEENLMLINQEFKRLNNYYNKDKKKSKIKEIKEEIMKDKLDS